MRHSLSSARRIAVLLAKASPLLLPKRPTHVPRRRSRTLAPHDTDRDHAFHALAAVLPRVALWLARGGDEPPGCAHVVGAVPVGRDIP